MNKNNSFKGIFEGCPPTDPHMMLVNAALLAVGEAHGAAMNDLSEYTNQLLLDVASTAAQAALDAARVSNDWSSVFLRPQPTPASKPLPSEATVSPCWETDIVDTPLDLYISLAWTYQCRQHPGALSTAHGYSETMREQLYPLIDSMITFALTAAGVFGSWEGLYSATAAKMGEHHAD